MTIFTIARSTVKQVFRNIGVLLMMTAMPIVIIFILGSAFSSQIGGDANINVNEINIEYRVVGESGLISEGVKECLTSVAGDALMEYKENDNQEDALLRLGDNLLTNYIVIDENERSITCYLNEEESIESKLMESVIQTYASRYSVIAYIATTNPQILAEMNTDAVKSYVNRTTFGEKETLGAMDYYSVSMCVLFVLYGMMYPAMQLSDNRKKGIDVRLHTSPTKSRTIFIGMSLGFATVTTLEIGFVLLFSKFVYGAYLGTNLGAVCLLLFSLIIMVVSFGMFLGTAIDKEGLLQAVMQTLIIFMGFFGGAYVALEDLGGTLGEIGKYVSLNWWNNTALFDVIYNQSYVYFWKTLVLNIGLAALFIALASVIRRKREVA